MIIYCDEARPTDKEQDIAQQDRHEGKKPLISPVNFDVKVGRAMLSSVTILYVIGVGLEHRMISRVLTRCHVIITVRKGMRARETVTMLQRYASESQEYLIHGKNIGTTTCNTSQPQASIYMLTNEA